MDTFSVESLKQGVKDALKNKQNASLDQWAANIEKQEADYFQLLRVNEVKKLTTLSKSTIALWVAQSRFPKPIPLSPTVKVWRLSDIKKWLDQRVYETEGDRDA